MPPPLRLVLRTFGYVGRVLAQLRGAPAVGAGSENLRVRVAAQVRGARRLRPPWRPDGYIQRRWFTHMMVPAGCQRARDDWDGASARRQTKRKKCALSSMRIFTPLSDLVCSLFHTEKSAPFVCASLHLAPL